MKILTITGWGQRHDAIDEFAKGLGEVTNVPYVNYKGIEDFLTKVKKFGKGKEVVIGWSLGAQLSVRAVAAGALKPNLLVLIAPPFQYVSDKKFPAGIHHMAFYAFQQAYSAFPSNTLRKFGVLVCQNDDHAMNIIATMDEDKEHHAGWIRWLKELGDFSSDTIDFSSFPKTLIFHGDGDAVTNIEQGKMFHKVIKNSKMFILEHCGHAPHLHDPEFIKTTIRKELR